ncbi:hypothetical protein INT44_003550 [Umbelopsis vinacea]|uniref:Ras-GEF domain-containing protein n=1 Tax=Umbelopsis vinacea TaxID=44442 RepID=A0A8H7UCH2_9FUNG|nr:hypothetical protein INT44_003550 [Umbelopsis vinacea]
MEDPQLLLSQAANALDGGAMEVSLQQLREAKFVHHSIVSHPAHYETLVLTIRSSLDSLDSIVLKRHGAASPIQTHASGGIHTHRTGSPVLDKKWNNVSNGHTRHSSHSEDDSQSIGSDHSSRAKSPPLIPPKPTRMQKPSVAPKPIWKPPRSISPPSTQTPAALDRSAISSISSITSTTPTSTPPLTDPPIKRPVPLPPAISTSTSASTQRLKLPSAIARSALKQRPRASSVSINAVGWPFIFNPTESSSQHLLRRISSPNLYSIREKPTSRPLSSSVPSHGIRPKTMDLSSSEDSGMSTIRIVAEGHVDPTDLVPAQTNPGDSLAPPTSFGGQPSDYVPNIPVPPLLTTYRNIQQKLTKVEGKLNNLKTRKQQMLKNESFTWSQSSDEDEDMLIYPTEESINDAIFEYTSLTAETKDTLNKVRTLYMSAATVPTITQFPPHLIAYQLTLIESAIFAEIPPEALLYHSARTPHARIVSSTDFFNYTTRAIEHSILLQQEAAHRAEHIHLWVKIAGKCLALNNYQTLKAIISALGTPPVQRLKRTWACIPKKSLSKLETLGQLMSESNNYENYREHMGMINTSGEDNRSSTISIKPVHILKPTVPFLGTFIHDMTYLLAATKSLNEPIDDPRIQGILLIMQQFQSGPKYPEMPPSAYIKLSQKHSFRPTSITNALHRSSSSKTRISSTMFFSNGGIDEYEVDKEVEVQQQIITQYLLMRPWVSEKNIDELSFLREPPKQRRGSSPGHARTRSGTGSGTYASSVLSTTSTISRFSTGNTSLYTTASGSGSDSRPTSTEEFGNHINEEHSPTTTEAKQRGFWSFANPLRKNSDVNRSHLGSLVGRRSMTDLRTVVAGNGSMNEMAEEDNDGEKEIRSAKPDMMTPHSNMEDALWKSVADQAVSKQQSNVYSSVTTNDTTSQQTFTSPKPPTVPNVPPRHVPVNPSPMAPPKPLAQPPSIPPRQYNAIGPSPLKNAEDELKAALAKRYASES